MRRSSKVVALLAGLLLATSALGQMPSPPGGGGGASNGAFVGCTTSASSATSIAVSSIPSTYTNLIFSFTGRSATGASEDTLRMRLNGDTSASDYYWAEGFFGPSTTAAAAVSGTTVSSIAVVNITAATSGAGFAGTAVGTVANYASTTFDRQVSGYGGYAYSGTRSMSFWGQWNNTSTAVNSISMFLNSGAAFVDGSTLCVWAQ